MASEAGFISGEAMSLQRVLLSLIADGTEKLHRDGHEWILDYLNVSIIGAIRTFHSSNPEPGQSRSSSISPCDKTDTRMS